MDHPELLDVSELLRPEGKEFRTYDVNSTDFIQERVRRTYYTMHTNQTVEFVEKRVCNFSV